MANLLDTLRQNRAQLQGQQAPMTDETQKVQGLLRAKTGKAIGSTDAAASNIAEQAAVQETQSQLGQLAPQIAAQQAGEDIAQRRQELQTEQSKQRLDQARKFQTVENKLKTNQLLADLERDRGSLDLEKDKSRLEQASFLLSMQDQKYVNDLQDVGRRQRLDNAANFNRQLEELAFGGTLDLLQSKLGKQDIMAANDREFSKAMADLSIDDALRVAQIESAGREQAAKMGADVAQFEAAQQAKSSALGNRYQGLQGLVSGGLQAYNAYETGKERNAQLEQQKKLDELLKSRG